jgi:hypothetical protein
MMMPRYSLELNQRALDFWVLVVLAALYRQRKWPLSFSISLRQ